MVRGEERDAPGGGGAPMERQQANSYIDGLGVRYFHAPLEEHGWARALEDGAPQVADEFARVALAGSAELDAHGNNVWASLADVRGAKAAEYGPEWRTLGLQDRGIWDPVNTRLFPATTALLHSSGVPCVEAFFAKMSAGSKIGAHSDGCNFHLTAHLGVDVPEGECWLQVGTERREWANGKLMLFDTSVLHRAANEAARDRYVLMMRVWHPELAPIEIDALKHIFACLDDPEKAMIGTAGGAPPVQQGRGAAEPGAPPAAQIQMSRAERRRAERAAKKSSKRKR